MMRQPLHSDTYAVGLRGDATNTAVVTVNGHAVQSDDITSDTIPWHFALAADNGSGPDFPFAEIVAVINPPGTNAPDIVSTSSGHLYAPPQNETLTYDDDGNLTADGRFTYTWDAENRLIAVVTRDDLPAAVPRVKVEYAYDHQSRRIASSSAVWINGSWQAVESRVFLYDGWNVVSEHIHTQTHTLTNSYLWGLDLSGSLQGAGGIGGLLAASLDGTTALYCHDANGNVGQLADADGALLAHYEYSPFGETIVSTGPLAKSNPFRFSTKWFDNDTGLGYWGYRWYSPGLGRWPSRDPIGDHGFLRQYGQGKSKRDRDRFRRQALAPVYLFGSNSPVTRFDPAGLITFDSSCDAPDALLPADKTAINAEIIDAKNKLQDYDDGTISLPSNLTDSMASCIKGKLDSVTVKCMSCANPVCWYADGFSWPGTGKIGVCAYKIMTQPAPITGMTLMIFHHSCPRQQFES